MPRNGLLFAGLTLTTSLACAADSPSTPQSPSSTSASSTLPAATPVSSPPGAGTSNRIYAGGLTNPEVENAFRKFSKRVVGDQIRYCRRETPLGTRLGKSVCYSAEQVLEMARAEREAGDELQRTRDIKGTQ
jgi:hypothetical protein